MEEKKETICNNDISLEVSRAVHTDSGSGCLHTIGKAQTKPATLRNRYNLFGYEWEIGNPINEQLLS